MLNLKSTTVLHTLIHALRKGTQNKVSIGRPMTANGLQ